MAEPAQKAAGWDDLLGVPEGYVGEIVSGELRVHPRPGPPHLESASDLGTLLGSAFRFGRGGPGGWVIIDEPRIGFGQDIRVPDLAGWKRERYVRPERGPYTALPDWICEVLSPSTAAEDRTEKLPLYADSQVPFVWIVDPVLCSLEAYRLEAEGYLLLVTARGDRTLRIPPFDAIELELGLLWGDRWDPAAQPPQE